MINNCRCCKCSYDKSLSYWCCVTSRKENGTIQEPKGFCEFCDRNNETWYMPTLKCHNEN